MVQLIGIMIGAYIFTRTVEISLHKDTHIALGILAILTALITAACTFFLVVFPSANQFPS